TDRNGNANAAWSFDGISNYMVAAGDGLPIGNAERTVTMWVDMADQHGQWGITSWGNGDCTGLMFGLGYQGSTTFWGGCDDIQSAPTFPTATWTFVAVVFTQTNNIELWTNTTSQTFQLGTDLATNASQLFVGGETITNDVGNFRNYFAGAIDNLRIYNRALTD